MKPIKWQPLKKAVLREEKPKGIIKKAMRIREHRKELNRQSKNNPNIKRISYRQAKESLDKMDAREYYANNQFFCTIDYSEYDADKPVGMNNYVSIGIHSKHKEPDMYCGLGWQIKQWIKNEILGEEWEAVELYPAESRMMNTANEYWLFCYNGQIPFGFTETRNVTDSYDGGYGKGARQDLIVKANEMPVNLENQKQENER